MSRAVACLLVILLCLAGRAAVAERVALVIGNAAYRHTSALANPANDARDTAAALRAIGFRVTEALDLDRQGMLEALRAFEDATDRADIALLFFAGHAVQVPTPDRRGTRNWLLPVDALIAREAHLETETFSLDNILQRMAGARARIVLLDACRDNPLAERMIREDRTRGGLPRGLGRSGALPSGALVAFATASGETAADGRGRNSPFTEGLLRHINTPGVDVGDMLQEVRRTVAATTNPPQRPDIDNQLSGRVMLVQAPPAVAPAPVPVVPTPAVPTPGVAAPPSEALDLAFWTSIQNSRDPRDYEAYLLTYPQGRFAALARIRIEQLRTAAAPTPPATPPAPDPVADPRARAELEQARALAEELRRQQEALARQQEELARQREEIRRAAEQREREATARAEAEARERVRALELERQRRAEQERLERERQQAEAERLERERRAAAARVSNEQTEAALNMSVANWTWVQERLAALNHNIGGVDGVAGPRTRAAIRAFQSANGFPDSGFLNQALVDLLDQQGTPAMQRAERGRREAEERARREAEDRTRREAEERQRREVDDRARARARAVALAWNSAGAWATRAADTIEMARDAALRACNDARGATPACVLSNHFIPANTRRCMVVHRNGNRLFVSTAATMEETRNTNIGFCQREAGSGCSEVYAWCGEQR